MTNNTNFTEHTGFKLYLEGVKVPFSNITIRQAEGDFPSASISMVGTASSLKLLPDTKVLFTGEDPQNKTKQIILFEGEVKSISYQKTDSGRIMNLACHSLLFKWRSVTATPNDVLVSQASRNASGEFRAGRVNLNDNNPDLQQTTRGLYDEYIRLKNQNVRDYETGELRNALSRPLTATGEAGLQFNSLMSEDATLETIIGYFLRKFEDHDLFYGLDAMSYKLPNSVLVMPNIDKLRPFIVKATIENFRRTVNTMGNPLANGKLFLFNAIVQFIQTFMYNINCPAYPTSTSTFWSKFSGRSPVRAYIAPSLEHAPPAQFNVFFPSMVRNFSYNRDFSQEPTRTICEMDYTGVPGAERLFNLRDSQVFPFSYAPNLDLSQGAIEKNRIGFTVEETYRGINMRKDSFNWYLSNTPPNSPSPIVPEDQPDFLSNSEYLNKHVKDPLNEYTVRQHYKFKLQGRSLNLQAVWSPYRMVGVPGAIIGDNHSPSVTGTITAITDSYNGSGGVTSTITFRNVRVIHDESDTDLLSEKEKNSLISEDTLDPYMEINGFLFNEDFYNSKNIGETYYPILKYGDLHKNNQSILNASKNNKAFLDFPDKIKSLMSSSDIETDCSIFNVLKEKTHETSEDYTKAIKQAIKIYKDDYYSIAKNVKMVKIYTDSIVFRNLTTVSEYKSFIGIDPANDFDNEINYKDSVELLKGSAATDTIVETIRVRSETGPRYNPSEFDRLTLEIAKNRAEREILVISEERRAQLLEEFAKLDKELKLLTDEVSGDRPASPLQETTTVNLNFANEALKPYVLTRKAHVKYALSSHIKENTKFEDLTIGHNFKLNFQS